jgi:hypothetical protein
MTLADTVAAELGLTDVTIREVPLGTPLQVAVGVIQSYLDTIPPRTTTLRAQP